MSYQPTAQNPGKVSSWVRAVRSALFELFHSSVGRSRLFIVGSGILVCAYALGVICCVLTVPDIGIRCAFTNKVDHFVTEFLAPKEQEPLQTDDEIVRLGGHPVGNW